jgi:hypothetical protein
MLWSTGFALRTALSLRHTLGRSEFDVDAVDGSSAGIAMCHDCGVVRNRTGFCRDHYRFNACPLIDFAGNSLMS